MPTEISEDLRWCIVYLFNDDLSITEIANTLYVSKSFVIKIINLYEKWACVTNPVKGIPGRRKLFNRRDMCMLCVKRRFASDAADARQMLIDT
jgi:hypothetical protein